MNKRRSNQYTHEFRNWAVKLAEESDLSIPEIAKQLDVNPKNIYNWRAQVTKKQACNKSTKQVDLQKENKQLKKEIAQLQEERLILKKACAYFARDIQ